MKDANTATNDTYNPEIRLDNTIYLSNAANRQVREDKEFYIPDALSEEDSDVDIRRHTASAEHARHLIKATGLLAEARDMIGVLIASLGDEVDARAMQTDTALRFVEKKLGKAYNRIDKHDRLHTNLFLAYFDLKDKTDERKE